jgi:photosystem II stability/assembly factor-like uncharacterized protein
MCLDPLMSSKAPETLSIILLMSLTSLTLLFAESPGTKKSSSWEPVTLTNPELRAKGTITGDGCQWVRALAIDPVDGNFLLWCTDVGGLFRSLDGGKTWEPSNVGFDSRGSAGVAIDPYNPARAVVVAANSAPTQRNGVYLTTDMASSWKQVLPIKMSATRDMRRQIAYDPSSYDPELGYTKTIYWSTLSNDPAHNPAWGETMSQPAFYKSGDGGETWQKLPGGEVAADAILAVHPTKGWIYAGTPKGLIISKDGGKSWSHALSGKITGVSVSPSQSNTVWVSQPDGLSRSDDSGATFQSVPGVEALKQKESPLMNITVSPSHPERMMIWRQGPAYAYERFYSHDGGATWGKSVVQKDRVIVPTNARQGLFSFHPKNPDIILAPGGDYPVMSHDGGKTFTFAGNGVNNVFVGGTFQFSATDPNIIFFGSQDYATFFSEDGGHNWTYSEPGGKGWGGYNYGGYASSPDTLIVGEAETWRSPKLLTVSKDGGKTWKNTDLVLNANASYGDPKNSNTLFAGHWRTADAGITWAKMDGVSAIYTHNPADGTLYGVHSVKDSPTSYIVKSQDGGITWEPVFQHHSAINDLSVDPVSGKIFFVSEGNLMIRDGETTTRVESLVHDQDGLPYVRSVSIDPTNPSIVYMAGNRNQYASNASAQRSLDGGRTWTNLTHNQPLNGTQKDGGRESMWVRVHPTTREAWFITNCYGLWKHAPAEAPTQSE